MKVVVPADPGEVLAALREVIRISGPAFIRLSRAETEVLHEDAAKVDFRLGEAERICEGKDITLVAMGMMVWESMRAAKMLELVGLSAEVINIRSVKPLDKKTIINSVREDRGNCCGRRSQLFWRLGRGSGGVLSIKLPRSDGTCCATGYIC